MVAEEKIIWSSISVSSVIQLKMYVRVCLYICVYLFIFSLFIQSCIHSITKISNKLLATLGGMYVQVFNDTLQFQGEIFFHVSYNIRLGW